MELLDQLGKALRWLKEYDKRNNLESIGETIILSILSCHTSDPIVRELLIRAAKQCEINDAVDEVFVNYALANSPPSNIILDIPPTISLDSIMKLSLMYSSFNEDQKSQLKTARNNFLRHIRLGGLHEFDVYLFCHFVMATTAFGLISLPDDYAQKVQKYLVDTIKLHPKNTDLITEYYLSMSYIHQLDVPAATKHLQDTQLEDGSFDRGTAKYDSNLHSTLVAVWLIAEILGKHNDNH